MSVTRVNYLHQSLVMSPNHSLLVREGAETLNIFLLLLQFGPCYLQLVLIYNTLMLYTIQSIY